MKTVAERVQGELQATGVKGKTLWGVHPHEYTNLEPPGPCFYTKICIGKKFGLQYGGRDQEV